MKFLKALFVCLIAFSACQKDLIEKPNQLDHSWDFEKAMKSDDLAVRFPNAPKGFIDAVEAAEAKVKAQKRSACADDMVGDAILFWYMERGSDLGTQHNVNITPNGPGYTPQHGTFKIPGYSLTDPSPPDMSWNNAVFYSTTQCQVEGTANVHPNGVHVYPYRYWTYAHFTPQVGTAPARYDNVVYFHDVNDSASGYNNTEERFHGTYIMQ